MVEYFGSTATSLSSATSGSRPEALPFLGGFAGSGMLTLVKVIELGAGLLLLSNRFMPLALALLAPIIVGIFAVHALLAPAGLPIAIVFLVLELVTAWSYRNAFAPMLRAKTPSPILEKRVAPEWIPAR